MICHTCIHRRIKPDPAQHAGGTIYGCSKKGIRFGYKSDWVAGTNQPKECKDKK